MIGPRLLNTTSWASAILTTLPRAWPRAKPPTVLEAPRRWGGLFYRLFIWTSVFFNENLLHGIEISIHTPSTEGQQQQFTWYFITIIIYIKIKNLLVWPSSLVMAVVHSLVVAVHLLVVAVHSLVVVVLWLQEIILISTVNQSSSLLSLSTVAGQLVKF